MNTNDMPVIDLIGTPYERGYSYGKKLESKIKKTVEGWSDHLGGFNPDGDIKASEDPSVYLSHFFKYTDYLTAIDRWTPHLLEEIRGIAKGSGQPFDVILGLQLMDEEWVFGLRQGIEKPIDKCTAFGLRQAELNVVYAGQNLDIGSWSEGLQTLLRIGPSSMSENSSAPQALLFSIAGNIGLNGLNAKGLGITCNTLAQLNPCMDGLPVAFIVRAVLEKNSIDEAEDFLRSVKHASGQNYILSTGSEIRCFECSAHSVERYHPTNDAEYIVHTNHPLVNTDINHLIPPIRIANSIARFKSINGRLNKCSTVDLSTIKAALGAHDDPDNPVSRVLKDSDGSIGYTAGSSIYEFGETLKYHLASGPPCKTPYKVYHFTEEGVGQ